MGDDVSSDVESETDVPKVLVVEDEENLADLYAAFLGDSYPVETVYAGEDALDQLDDSVGVVYLDRVMPGLSGDEVLEEIRNRDLECRVVIVSAVTPDFDVIGLGFDEYIVKPVGGEDLRATIERMLDRMNYDETVQRYHQLVATRAALAAEKSTEELHASDEFAELEAEINELQSDPALEEFDESDHEAAF